MTGHSPKLRREEKLACIIALEKEKRPGGWAKSALSKLLKSMKMARVE